MIREIVASFCEIQTVNPERWKQIDEILQQALSQLPANRETFLNQTCAGDTELRREVESLLEHDG